jgi:hypothetical protein
MNEADKIRMENYEQQIDMLEKENKALRKELFKYKLKEGESEEPDDTAQDILEKIRARQNSPIRTMTVAEKKQVEYGKKIWKSFMNGYDW